MPVRIRVLFLPNFLPFAPIFKFEMRFLANFGNPSKNLTLFEVHFIDHAKESHSALGGRSVPFSEDAATLESAGLGQEPRQAIRAKVG